jgi:hypothetical protein
MSKGKAGSNLRKRTTRRTVIAQDIHVAADQMLDPGNSGYRIEQFYLDQQSDLEYSSLHSYPSLSQWYSQTCHESTMV